MKVVGRLERVNPTGIGGWCVDEDQDGPIDVELRVGAVVLGTVRADLARKDIQKTLRRCYGGFRFPISAGLFRLLPHGGKVEALAQGRALPVMRGCNPLIDNPGGTGAELLEKLKLGYLISPKAGNLFQPVKHAGEGMRMLDALAQCERIFQRISGNRLFVCYGTLLGLVRDGGFIAHDDDVDVCFLAKAEGMRGAVAEFRELVAALRARGERVRTISGAQFHWRKAETSLDVFMAWMEGDVLCMYNAGGKLSRDQIHPVGRGRLEGRSVPVPNNPEALLELIYGSRWRIPNPGFQWRLTPQLRAKKLELETLWAELSDANGAPSSYWPRFYRTQRVTIPSPFAAAVAVELSEPSQIIDLGCGNGRDSVFFARLGHQVLGLDLAATAIDQAMFSAANQDARSAAFEQADLRDPATLSSAIESHFATAPVIYARFLLHAVTEEVEASLLDVLANELPPGGRCYFEFRTMADQNIHKHFGRHYRRFINLEDFVAKAVAKGPMECVYKVEGRGMAKFGGEDPVVGRVHLLRSRAEAS